MLRATVLIGSSRPLIAVGLETALIAADLKVVGRTDGFDDLVALRRSHRPAVLIADVETLGGPDTAAALADATTGLLLQADGIPASHLRRRFTMGVRGAFRSQDPVEEVVDAASGIARGRRALSASVQSELVGLAVDAPAEQAPDLSPRELEVLRAVARGARTADVAAGLFMAEDTVKTHLRRASRKLGTHSRAQLVGRAKDLGII